MASTGSISSGTGLVSGTDYSTLISDLMSVAEKPLTLLKSKSSAYNVTLSAYSSLSSNLSGLKSAMDTLASSSGGFNLLAASSSNETAVTVKAASGAATGSYSVTVNQLATEQKLKSTTFGAAEAVGAGTLTLTGGGKSTDITVGSTDTIADVAAAINKANAGVTASVVTNGSNRVLMLKANDTGASNAFTISVNDADGNNTDANGLSRLSYAGDGSGQMSLTQAAQDASLTIDGVAVTSSSNAVTTMMEGLTLNLKSTTSSAVKVDVKTDTEGITKEIQAFVDAYNSVADYISSKQGYDKDTSTAGSLLGDSTTNRIRNTLRNFMNGSVSGTTLSDLGINMNKDGHLQVNSDKLEAALDGNFDKVKNFFTDSANGLAAKMSKSIDSWVNSKNGLLTRKSEGLQNSIDRLGERQSVMQSRLNKQEDMLRAKFNALETLLSTYSSTASSVDSLVSVMSGLNSQISGK